jgi:hypothetical protein
VRLEKQLAALEGGLEARDASVVLGMNAKLGALGAELRESQRRLAQGSAASLREVEEAARTQAAAAAAEQSAAVRRPLRSFWRPF